jgi:hypothetical protein
VFARAGQPDRALDCVEQAKQAGYEKLDKLRVDDDLISLHASPRWQAVFP